MAVGMSEARRMNGSKVNTETKGIEKEKLICFTCNARVSFVRAYDKRPGIAPRPVHAHFRLRKGEAHDPGCGPTIIKQKRIRARRDEKGIVQSLRESKFEIRLIIGRRPALKAESSSPATAARNTSVTYERSSKYLSPYISTAEDVLLVEDEISKNPDIESRIRLIDGEGTIAWKDFYFERAEYDRCFKMAENAVMHDIPAAVRGVVWDNYLYPEKAPTHAVLELTRMRQGPDSRGIHRDFYCSIRSEKLSAFKSFQPGQEIVALGIWQAQKRRPGTNQNAHNLRMQAKYLAHVCAIKKRRRKNDSVQPQLTG